LIIFGGGDIILKGANTLDPVNRKAPIFVAHPQAGTIGAAPAAVIGRSVQLFLPTGLKKRIYGNLDEIASKFNVPRV
jgi:hypothetical protein